MGGKDVKVSEKLVISGDGWDEGLAGWLRRRDYMQV